MSVHPIEAESYRILRERVDLSRLDARAAAVIARVVHASADLDYVDGLRLTGDDVQAGLDALDAGAAVIADVEMVKAAVTSLAVECCLPEIDRPPDGLTRTAAAMRVAAERHPRGAVVVVGCAPTALVEVVRLVESGSFSPALLIGLPVGFVGAAAAKDLAHAAAVPSITNSGEKGGSAVAAAALNAIVRLHRDRERR